MDNNYDDNSQEFQFDKGKRKAAFTAASLIPSNEVLLIVGDLEVLTPQSLAILKQRGQEWHEKYPLGEPYFSQKGELINIYPNQLATLLRIELDIAKHLVMVAQKVLGKDENVYVTVNEFSHLFNLNEEEIRATIELIPPDFRLN